MVCKFCHKRIGRVRGLIDPEFCSAAHRKIYAHAKRREETVFSARLLRDFNEDVIEENGVLRSDRAKEKKTGLPMSAAILVLLTTALVVIWIPRGSGTAPVETPDYSLRTDSLWAHLRQALPSPPAIQLREDFHSGFQSWQVLTGQTSHASDGAGDWIYHSGFVRPGKLGLWAPSLLLSDYSFDFHAAIEKKGMGWAFRASNVRNYYAAKISIVRPGPLPLSNVIRYAVVNGQPSGRVELPLPMSIHTGTLYEVSVIVKGSHFTTSINGQVVDTWTDSRLHRGGVGFFAGKDEVASIVSVNVLTPRNFLERIFSSSFLISPIDLDQAL